MVLEIARRFINGEWKTTALEDDGGGGAQPALQSWLKSDAFAVSAGAFVSVTLTGVIQGGGPGYTNGPDDLNLAGQLPSDYPLLDAGTYRIFGTLSCGDALIAAAAPGGAILFQPRGVVGSALTNDGETVTLPCPAATGARTGAQADFIVSAQDVIDGDNGLVVSVGNYSDQDLTAMNVTVIIEKTA